VVVTGIAAQAIAWRLVAIGRARFWPVVAAIWAIVGTAAIAGGEPRCCAERTAFTAILVGLASGLVLFVATRFVVSVAVRWAPLARAVGSTYGRSEGISPRALWLISLAIVVPGEEVFWRGVVTPWLREATGPIAGVFLAWLAAVGVTLAWADTPFLAAAVVGGALWTSLAVWSGGVLAPLASHLVWTACMLAWPPPAGRAKVTG
jgi:membrane protease YdiL (CAAX protease family)